MKYYQILVLLFAAGAVASCGKQNANGNILCHLEFRNAGGLAIPSVRADKGGGFFTVGYLGAGTHATFVASEFSRNAKEMSVSWSFEKDVVLTNVLTLPASWNKLSYPKIVITISNQFCQVEVEKSDVTVPD